MTVSPLRLDLRPGSLLRRTVDGSVAWTVVALATLADVACPDGQGLLVPVSLDGLQSFVEEVGRPYVTTHVATLGVMLDEADLIGALGQAELAVARCLEASLLPVLVGAGLGYAVLPDLRGLPWGMVWPSVEMPTGHDDRGPLTLLAGLADAARSEHAEIAVSGGAGDDVRTHARAIGAHQLASPPAG